MPLRTMIERCPVIAGLLLQTVVLAEIYIPPHNIIDPAKAVKPGATDTSLPFIYLEPHEGCFDLSKPLIVTIYAVNRSQSEIKVDWRSVVESLSMEAIGPGIVKPASATRPIESVPVRSMRMANLRIDLKNYFDIRGASSYRLTYARPLEDGRIHIAAPVTFVIEDTAAIEKVAEVIEMGSPRDTVANMLKQNPLFASGTQAKSYGDDAWSWDEPEMKHTRWEAIVNQARVTWEAGLEQLTAKGAPASHVRALEALVDRLLILSDNFRCPTDWLLFHHLTPTVEENLPLDARQRIHLKLVRSHNPRVVSLSINRLMILEHFGRNGIAVREDAPVLDAIVSIADGLDKRLAAEAISSLSSFRPDPRIAQFLRRKMTDVDVTLALEAAIVSCYSGDWSGLPVLLRMTRSDDPKLRLNAIAQLADSRYRPHVSKVVPLLLAELKDPLSDAHLERAVESLGTYPSTEVVEAVTPLLQHHNPLVSKRARLSLDRVQRGR